MKIFKTALIIYMCLVVCFVTTACDNNDYSDAQIAFSTVSSVSTFDPQLAKTEAEITIASNCFEGLLTKDDKGNIINGAIESYSVDNFVYNFKIKDNLLWSDGETPLTAKDFEFGIKRAVLKQTNSPFAPLLYSIKNAEKINKGKASIETLGVKANENTLQITLERADDGFLETLTKPLCFPCNETFFNETAGKYGLKSKYIISNGAFSIEYYNTDTKTVIIKNSEDYKGETKAIPKSVTINYSETYDSIYSDFESGEIDVGSIDCSYLSSLEELGNKSKLFYDSNYCLYISDDLISESGVKLNKALSYAIDNGVITSNINDYYGNVSGIIPDINVFGGSEYRKQVGNVSLNEYNPQKSENMLGDYEQASDVLNGLNIYHPTGESRLALISNLIAQEWQKDLNIFINSAEEEPETINSKIVSGDIKIAVIKVSSENNEAQTSFNSLNSLEICEKSNVKTAKQLFQKEQSLISDGIIYPLLSVPTAISFGEQIEGLCTSKDGKTIDFRHTKKS